MSMGPDNGRRPAFSGLYVGEGAEGGLELHGTKTGRLPSSGTPMSGMRAERNRDYPDDTDLCFERGQYTDRIRLTPADVNGLRALLTAGDDLKELRRKTRDFLRGLAESRLAGPPADRSKDVEALERVIEMLQRSR